MTGIQQVINELIDRVILNEEFKDDFHPKFHPLFMPLDKKTNKRLRDINDEYFKQKTKKHKVRVNNTTKLYHTHPLQDIVPDDQLKEWRCETLYNGMSSWFKNGYECCIELFDNGTYIVADTKSLVI